MLYQAKLVRAPMPFWRVVVEAKFDRRAKRWPRNSEACDSYGQLCAYFGVCCGETRIDDDTRFR